MAQLAILDALAITWQSDAFWFNKIVFKLQRTPLQLHVYPSIRQAPPPKAQTAAIPNADGYGSGC